MWNPIVVGEKPTRANFQQVVNRVHDIEDNVLKFESPSRLMSNNSGDTHIRTVAQARADAGQGIEPGNKWSGWDPEISPTFTKTWIADEHILDLRAAIDNVHNYKDSCRTHYAANYLSYLAVEMVSDLTPDNSIANSTVRGDVGDEGDRNNRTNDIYDSGDKTNRSHNSD